MALLYDQGSCPDDGVPDMTSISDIDENGINRNLQVRYDKDLIYTYTGTILVAVNPYKELDIYTSEQVFRYHGQKIRTLDPHVFAIAEAAYKSLQDGEVNQSCVISGESGAGKTESTKFILQYLCSVTSNVSTWVEQQILEANTILEAFGNAKTVRNDNSSRFGKFMQVCFDNKWMIKGCIIQDYLLEQSRITFQSPEERNYHVFYQLVSGGQTNKELSEQFVLKPANTYQYLCQSGCTKIEGISDARKFDALRLAFNVLHIPQEKIDGIYSVISSVLWLGNLKFEDIDGEKCRLKGEDKTVLETISKLLGLNIEDLEQVVLLRQITVRGNVTEIPLRIQEARENRHAMAKALYSRTFAWLVDHINKCTNPGKDSSRFLGVLDIFGFENFNVNSFEQLCINYTNEKLHKFFNHYVFALEQEIYEMEQIEFSHIEFTDNSECLELIEKPPKCILKLLTEECRMPKGSDSSYLTKLHQEFEQHPHYIKGGDRRKWEAEFSIKHYAGGVTYNIQGFVDKNRDTQQDVFLDFMSRSDNTFVKELSQFQDLLGSAVSRMSSEKRNSLTPNDKRASVGSTGSTGAGTVSKSTSKGKPTVGDAFRYQLQALVDVLQSTNPWYVRCIKPNMLKQADTYDTSLVLDQLKYLGMCDIIRIRKEGFPIHLTFTEFIQRYNCIIRKNKFKLQPDPKESIRLFLKSLNSPIKEWQIGKTKVFLRTKVHEPLEDHRKTILMSAIMIMQRVWRGFRARKQYYTVRKAVLCIQRLLRGKRQRLQFLRKKRATIVLQTHLRGMFAREVAAALKEMKRLEEEMRKKEILEEEVAARKAAEEKEIEDAQSLVKENISALSTLVEESEVLLESHRQSRVDLDNLFSFLAHSKQEKLGTSVLDEITNQMDNLASNFEEELNTLKLGEREAGIVNQTEQSMEPQQDIGAGPRVAPKPTLPPPPPVPEAFQDTKKKKKRVQISDNYEEIDIDVLDDLPPPPSPPALPAPTGFFDDIKDFCPTHHDPRKVVGIPSEQNIYEEIIRRAPTCNRSSSSQISKLANVERIKTESHIPRSPSPHRRRVDSGSPGPLRSPELVPLVNGCRNSSTVGSGMAHSWRQLEGDDPAREARKRHRVERRIHEIEVTEDHRNVETVYHDIIEFAEQNFNNHERIPEGTIIGTLRRKSAPLSESVPKYEMVTFTKTSYIPTSHIQLYDPDNVSIAINIFRDLCKTIREDSKPEQEVATIQSIIAHGIEREELRDEIYIQCMRQATNNPSNESLEKVWLVICLCVVAFHPSKALYKYFISFLHKNSHYEGKLKQYVQWCSANCKVTKVSCRKMPPSSVEIAAMKRLGTVVCRFFFMDGSTKTIDIHPCDTAGDAMQKIAEKKGLQSLDGWSIYECGTEGEKHVKAHDYLYDVISSWEINQSNSVRLSSGIYGTITKGTIHTKAIGAGDNKFIFRKRLFKNTKELSSDPVEINLLYAQAVYSVVKRDDFPVTEKDALKLAGLQAQVLHGDPKNKMEHYTSVDSYLPLRISQTYPPGDWIRILAEAHVHYGSNKADLVAKVLYLSCVMQYELYGAALYPVKYRGYWSYGNAMILGICCDRIKMVKPDDKFVLHEYKYSDIESIFIDPSDDFITINLPKTMTDAQRCFVFEAKDKVEIGSLIASYSPVLAGWMKETDGVVRKVRLTIEDRNRLYTNVVNSRRQLVDNDVVKKPSSDSGFFRSTLRRINRASSKWRNEGGADDWGETYKGFPHSYWAFSRHYLTDTLTRIADSDVGNAALEIFGLILSYSGLNDERENSTYVNEADHISIAQNIMERCMQKDVLLNELYLQLIKQTTDHPKPNSRINLRHWALLSLACSVILPPHKLIRKYLIAHLKKCSSDYISEEGKVARFADKCLHKQIGSGRRQWPPSRQEIICTINRRPIYARFHFMDGQFHSVEFDSSATTGDVLKLIQEKIGLKDTAKGYALYEVFGTHERSLLPAEKLADVLSKWERYRTSTTSRTQKKQHILLFKKHLFTDSTVDLEDPVEKELLFHQMLHCLKNDFFPVTPMEAAMLCALSAQIMLGDYCEEGMDYGAITEHYLPERIMNHVHPEAIVAHHQAMMGMDPHEAKQAFLNIIQSWPLHRATIFDVTQSFTSNWPKALWLAVDQVGIHLLEQRSKCVLCSYEYQDIINYSPSINSLMIITGSVKKQSKVILNTNQAFQIGSLIKDYTEILRPNAEEVRRRTDSESDGVKHRGVRPMSILETPLPEIPKNTFV